MPVEGLGLELIERAQTALRNGDAALALGSMQSLDQLQPKGALLVERAVVSVLALCRLDRANDARLLASATWKSTGGAAGGGSQPPLPSDCTSADA